MVRRRFSYCFIIAVCGLASCFGPPAYVVENRTVDLPVETSISIAKVSPGISIESTKGGALHNLDKAFYFTDPRPRVLVIGHVEVLEGGKPVNWYGALGFVADGFESNHSWWDGGDGLYEAVGFASGDWFAGHVYAGHRDLKFIRFSGGPGLRFTGCGSNIARFPEWKTSLDLNDPTKAYYLGHIRYNVTPTEISLLLGGRLEATVRDLSEQHEKKLRTLVGGREIERAMIPSCPE